MSPAGGTPIGAMAKIVRSKNAGPFQQTIDVLFDSSDDYGRIKASGALTHEVIARAYGLSTANIRGIYYWDSVRAVKIVITREHAAGTVGDSDCYGAQQHVPILTLVIAGRVGRR